MGLMKLWHDDVRPAPEGWVWARTNEEAKRHLKTGEVVEISMDHDLGLHSLRSEQEITEMSPDEFMDYLMLKGQSEENGLGLAQWMAFEGIIPEKITVHSWNPTGAQEMVRVLNEAGGSAVYRPFEPPGTVRL
jgi:hypothetical protein